LGIKKVFKSKISGTVYAPSSKSVILRAIALSLLTNGNTVIRNINFSDDVLAAINIVTELGVKTNISKETLVLESKGKIKNSTIYNLNCGESGLCLRMFSPILSLFKNRYILDGTGSLKNRTVEMVEKGLNKLGASCISNSGFLPVEINGQINGADITIDGSISSQFLSGLLIALPLCTQNSNIKVKNLKSRPYIDLTLKMVREAGIIIKESEKNIFTVKGNQKYNPFDIVAEGDWSGASFMLTAGAISGEIIVKNLQNNSFQADKVILDVLGIAGAEIKKNNDFIVVKKKDLNPFEFDISESPDLFSPIAVLAANCDGKSIINGTNRLKYKESKRGEVIKKEFKLLGIRAEIFKNRIEIYGGNIGGGKVSANNDHRIAMALAIMGISSIKGVEIDGWESVSKSYKDFFSDLQNIGGNIK